MNEQRKEFSTALTKINNAYFPMIEKTLVGNGINMNEYAKSCVMNAISSINHTLDEKGVSWNDSQLDQSNITQILITVASLELNPAANPREVYFQLRNVKQKVNGKDVWKKQVELGIEGDGNDAILARFGRNIKEVMQYWVVREGDEFEYPSYSGIELTPPKWTPKGQGKVVRVVYPIIRTNDVVEYHIGERHDVIRNLIAHVNNNLMNETFGIAESRFKATKEQQKQIQAKKNEILNRVEELGLDGALNDEAIQNYISPAWKDPQSRESMILRKIRNNIVKKIPKDFGNALVEMKYEDTSSDKEARIRKEINEQANSEYLDIEVNEEEKEPSVENPTPSEKIDIIDVENPSEDKDKVPF